jgi:hypothetical protein
MVHENDRPVRHKNEVVYLGAPHCRQSRSPLVKRHKRLSVLILTPVFKHFDSNHTVPNPHGLDDNKSQSGVSRCMGFISTICTLPRSLGFVVDDLPRFRLQPVSSLSTSCPNWSFGGQWTLCSQIAQSNSCPIRLRHFCQLRPPSSVQPSFSSFLACGGQVLMDRH